VISDLRIPRERVMEVQVMMRVMEGLRLRAETGGTASARHAACASDQASRGQASRQAPSWPRRTWGTHVACLRCVSIPCRASVLRSRAPMRPQHGCRRRGYDHAGRAETASRRW